MAHHFTTEQLDRYHWLDEEQILARMAQDASAICNRSLSYVARRPQHVSEDDISLWAFPMCLFCGWGYASGVIRRWDAVFEHVEICDWDDRMWLITDEFIDYAPQQNRFSVESGEREGDIEIDDLVYAFQISLCSFGDVYYLAKATGFSRSSLLHALSLKNSQIRSVLDTQGAKSDSAKALSFCIQSSLRRLRTMDLIWRNS
jgi:hypothetical protein